MSLEAPLANQAERLTKILELATVLDKQYAREDVCWVVLYPASQTDNFQPAGAPNGV